MPQVAPFYEGLSLVYSFEGKMGLLLRFQERAAHPKTDGRKARNSSLRQG